MRCSEKDQKLPKFFTLKSQNQGRKVNENMGEKLKKLNAKKKEKTVKLSKNNKSKWDDMKCREKD